MVLAEDTRTSKTLLKHFAIETHLQSFHMHNEHKALQPIIDQLLSGMSIALVSDAGTPGISDPGFLLSRACVENHIEIECLPGATAFVPALVVSGLPSDQFYFEGFLPHQKGRQKRLTALLQMECTVILYESPYRIVKLLEQLHELNAGNRKISISREISKKFETTVRGTVIELIQYYQSATPKGEFVVVLEGKKKEKDEN